GQEIQAGDRQPPGVGRQLRFPLLTELLDLGAVGIHGGGLCRLFSGRFRRTAAGNERRQQASRQNVSRPHRHVIIASASISMSISRMWESDRPACERIRPTALDYIFRYSSNLYINTAGQNSPLMTPTTPAPNVAAWRTKYTTEPII